MPTEVDTLVAALTHLRQTIVSRADDLYAKDRRTEDITWPCSTYAHVGARHFESRNACLVAAPPASTLWLSQPTLEDILAMVREELQVTAAQWFFVHQLVHVSQGLGYQDFRRLNRVGNRHETMRPDCDADFVSLKTLAILLSDGDAPGPHAGRNPLHNLHWLLDVVVPAMMQMDPNIFIPRQRKIEVQRLFALLLLRHYVDRALVAAEPCPDASLFPWWADDHTSCYVFVGQVNALGRGPVAAGADELRTITEALHVGATTEAYDALRRIDWPRLDTAALPTRLVTSHLGAPA